ncbi:hypothetical protein AGABI1DRAFT_95665 [Agaricus bisporus var. burnettii JB137-S8]|uniref:Uncharacterized protein n=1 Tax=Agaricus bisporus var. burnettii (strain JB137-S8 / ATCC MYA-4627 / FGSC 10392) TaxID=597362 RepID=K5WGJ8_AGABU|nr:uncharacterized protein AGABI1DRAFT_95665 [Agaricus bisporus var. burnettii JB137-S8]EKM74401.1 hypothetical protein AGABI1DRAFT_95665 [Agaricus bisporus var. burnettii JB137-S8]
MAHRPNAAPVVPTRGAAGSRGFAVQAVSITNSHDARLQSGLLHVQAELDAVGKDNATLRQENAMLKAKVNTQPSTSTRNNARVLFSGPLTIKSKKELQSIANRWMYFESPWLSQSVFGSPRPDPFDILSVKERYEDEAALLTYLTELVYQNVPPKFHNLIENFESFGSDFVKQVKNQRSVTMFKLHSNASLIFSRYPNITADLWSSAESRGDSEECCRLYLTEDEETGDLVFNPLLVPIIYARDDVGIDGIFQNEVLFSIRICTLYGPTAIRDGKIAQHSLGAKWRTKSVTAGFIAWTCIAAIHLLSHDSPFEEYGKKTGINYGDTFNEYKQRIEVHQDSALFRSIFAKWNQRLKLGAEDTSGASIEGADSDANRRRRVNARAASIDAALASNALDHSSLRISSNDRQAMPSTSFGTPAPESSPENVLSLGSIISLNQGTDDDQDDEFNEELNSIIVSISDDPPPPVHTSSHGTPEPLQSIDEIEPTRATPSETAHASEPDVPTDVNTDSEANGPVLVTMALNEFTLSDDIPPRRNNGRSKGAQRGSTKSIARATKAKEGVALCHSSRK